MLIYQNCFNNNEGKKKNTSQRAHILTSVQRHFDVMCLLGICLQGRSNSYEKSASSAIFTKGNNLCDLLFASLDKKAFLE